MKKSLILIPFVTFAFAQQKPAPEANFGNLTLIDTIPQVCAYFSKEDAAIFNPFTTMLSTIFPDPNAYETYTGCHFQFFTKGEYPQIAVRLIKWGSKAEAMNEFRLQVQSHFDHWNISPERVNGVADSAYFGYNTDDLTKCDECGMVAIKGVYAIYISFKGQYDMVPRARKKQSALKILEMMYAKIPGLAR